MAGGHAIKSKKPRAHWRGMSDSSSDPFVFHFDVQNPLDRALAGQREHIEAFNRAVTRPQREMAQMAQRVAAQGARNAEALQSALQGSLSPAARVREVMGKKLASQIAQSKALGVATAANRALQAYAELERRELAKKVEGLAWVEKISFSPLVRVQAKVARDALLGNQWQRTMISLSPVLRAREMLENISRLSRGYGSAYFPSRPGFGPYQPRPMPEDPGPTEMEPTAATDAEVAEHLRQALEEYVSALVDFYKQVSKLAEDHPVQALILFDILCRLIFMDRS